VPATLNAAKRAAVSSQPPKVKLLYEMADASASIAARAAECGHWDGDHWLYRVIQTEMRGALAERFTQRFNHALETRTGAAVRL
jgi:hypothetical protein